MLEYVYLVVLWLIAVSTAAYRKVQPVSRTPNTALVEKVNAQLEGPAMVFVLNLKRRRDRLQEFWLRQPQLDASNVEVIEAIDGASLGSRVDRTKPSIDAILTLTKNTSSHFMKSAEIGCFASHLVAWRRIAESKKDAIIFEDDAVFLNDFQKRWDLIGPSIQNRSKIGPLFVWIGGRTSPGQTEPVGPNTQNSSHVIPNTIQLAAKADRTTHAYQLNAPMAEYLLREAEQRVGSFLPVDYWLKEVLSNKAMEVFYCDPTLTYSPPNQKSDVQGLTGFQFVTKDTILKNLN